MSLELNKINIAERQLIEAIKLFFEERDPVSIHTLSGAVLGILRPIAKKVGVNSFFEETFEKYIRADKKKEYIYHLTKHRNFFKHAEQDFKETISFKTSVNHFSLYSAVDLHFKLTDYCLLELLIFQMWFTAKYADIFLPPFNEIISANIKLLDIDVDDLKSFNLLLNTDVLSSTKEWGGKPVKRFTF